MKHIFYSFCLTICVLFMACKSENNANQDATVAENTTANSANDALLESLERVVIKDEPTGDGNWDWTFLTNGILHYKNTMIVGEDASHNPYASHWIDMRSDGTYSTGIKKNTNYNGKWNYNHDAKVLTLIPEPADEKNSQWNVMFMDDVVIWVGTAAYADNATQIRLIRKDGYPE